MKKLITMLAAIVMVAAFAAPAGAQDEGVVGTVVIDPIAVPEAGEYTVTASGSGFIPDTTILLGACTAPVDELVFGESTPEEIAEAGGSINPLTDCDLTTALNIEVDSDGNFSAEWTGQIDANFFFSAGALDQSQIGGAWLPIADPAEVAAAQAAQAAQLAVTGAESWMIALFGAALLAVGALSLRGARRLDVA